MTEPLADADLLHVWETMRQHSLPRRMAALLALGAPGSKADDIAARRLSDCCRQLLRWRSRQFGPRFACVADCEACGEAFEFELDADELVQGLPAQAVDAAPIRFDHAGLDIELHAPTLGDCIAAADAASADAAYHALLRRCLAATSADGRTVPAEALPPECVAAADERIAAADAAAEWLLSLACPACGHEASQAFDIAAYCWAEIEARAPRLLAEVHLLASRYGWHEAEILAMGRLRRARYLEMVLA